MLIISATSRHYSFLRRLARRTFRAMTTPVGETGVSRDTFHVFSNIAENIYDRDFGLTRQGRGILPLQTGLISYVVTSFVETEYGVKDTWSSCPNLPRHGVGWDSTRDT